MVGISEGGGALGADGVRWGRRGEIGGKEPEERGIEVKLGGMAVELTFLLT